MESHPQRNHRNKIQIGRLPKPPLNGLVIPEEHIDNYVSSSLSRYGGRKNDHQLDDTKRKRFFDLSSKRKEFDNRQQELLSTLDSSFTSSNRLKSPSTSFRLQSAHQTPIRSAVSGVLQDLGSQNQLSSFSKTADDLPLVRTPCSDSFIIQDIVKADERQRISVSAFAQYGHKSSKASPQRTLSRGDFSSTQLPGIDGSFATTMSYKGKPDILPFSPLSGSSLKGKIVPLKAVSPVSDIPDLFSPAEEAALVNEIVEDVEVNDGEDSSVDENVGLVNLIVDEFGMLKDILLQSTALRPRPLSATTFLPETSAKYQSLKYRSRRYQRQPTQRNLLIGAAGYEDEDEVGVVDDETWSKACDAASMTPYSIESVDEMEKAQTLMRRRKTRRHTQHKINHIVEEREHLSLEIRHIGKHKYIPITDFTHKSAEETAALKELHNVERQCLIELFNQHNGRNWVRKDNWCTEHPVFTWFGVLLNAAGFVCELQLPCNNVHGVFPDVGRLTHLEVLCLDDNHLQGTLPGAIISKLRNIEVLSLQHNIFQGEIPFQMLCELKYLRELWLTNNHFCGEMHKSIGKTLGLTHFSLHRNEMSGPLPDSLRKLMNLKVLLLGDNHFTGQLPDSLKSLYKLTHLSLHNNKLSGPLPEWLEDLTHLHDLHLYGNNFEGVIPMSAEDLFERKRAKQRSRQLQL